MGIDHDTRIEDQLFQARLKANDFVQGFLKQLVVIASATVVLSVTFVSDVFGPNASFSWRPLLFLSWALLGLSVAAGVVALALLVNNLDVPDRSTGRSGLRKSYSAGTRRDLVGVSAGAIVLFLAGILSLALFAAHNFSAPRPDSKQDALAQGVKEIDRKLGLILEELTRQGQQARGSPAPSSPATAPVAQQPDGADRPVP